MFRSPFTLLLAIALPLLLSAQKPTAAQLQWHNTEFYFFLHFGPNTFTGREWGEGTETEDMFNPTDMDCEQWCKVALAAGAKGLIITAKHHDGFCLWPSKYSTHTVRESPWRNGKGDVLRDLSVACKKYGLKLGFYLSPWDRNHPKYGTPEYNDIYVATMTELMTQYGDLFEFWWDGANGEGPNGKLQVYDFKRFEREAARLQPNAVLFSDIGPGCRWAGNEMGTITETNWCTLDTVGFQRGIGAPKTDTLQTGNMRGKTWIPAECDVSIRPGWFYHSHEDDKVKTPQQLWDIYLKSAGRGANLILNIPPDQRGRIHPIDSVNLVEFGRLRKEKFAHNNVARGTIGGKNNKKFARLTDNQPNTYTTLSGPKAQRYIEVKLQKKQTKHLLKIQEYVGDGQFIAGFVVEGYDHKTSKWVSLYQGTTIGYRRYLELPALDTDRIRVWITSTKDNKVPAIAEIGVY